MKTKLDPEEEEILDAYEAGQTKSIKGAAKKIAKHREYVAATVRKDARLNIRLSSKDLHALQSKALAEGIPYQTLAASILHKFVEGRLKDQG